MTTNQFTILQDLPRFTENPGAWEQPFLRSLETYFLNNEITSDTKELFILYSFIDMKRGDALAFIICYSGQNVPFEEVKKDFINMYPAFKVTELRIAASALLKCKNPEVYYILRFDHLRHYVTRSSGSILSQPSDYPVRIYWKYWGSIEEGWKRRHTTHNH